MPIVLLLLSIACCVAGLTIQKTFSASAGILRKPVLLFIAVWAGIASLCYGVFLVVTQNFHMEPLTVICAILMGIMLTINAYTAMVAFQKGSLTLSVLILSMCVLVPSVLSIACLGEQLTWTQLVGFLLIAAVFIFVNRIKEPGQKVTLSWFVIITISSLANGIVMFASKLHQFYLPGKEIPQYFFLGFLVAAVVSLLLYFVLNRGEHGEYSYQFKRFWGPAVGVALGLGLTNLLNMVIASKLPAIVLFPSVQYGSVIVTTFISALVFHENNSRKTYISVFLGAAAILILNWPGSVVSF